MILYINENVLTTPKKIYIKEKHIHLLGENKYDQSFNEAYHALENFKKECAKKYGCEWWYDKKWMGNKFPEVTVDPNDFIKLKELKSTFSKISRLWNDEDNKEEELNNSVTQEPQKDVIELAKKEFSLTNNLIQAGYILPDGSLLNFGKDGYRWTDHRNIEAVYHRNNIEIWDNKYRYNYVADFMANGAIRIDANVGVIDLVVEPTNQQYNIIKQIATKTNGEISLDITSKQGDTICSAYYTHARPTKIVGDIYNYFNEGIRPIGESEEKDGKLLTEGISDVTYHYCDISSLYSILESNKIALTMSSNSSDAYHKTKLFYLSTQRSRSNMLGYASNHAKQGQASVARIELDGDLLMRDGYQGQPIDYWGAKMGKQSDIGLNAARVYHGDREFDDEDKKNILKSQGKSSNFEFEDRIFSANPSMPLKYIKRVDCFIPYHGIASIYKAILKLAEVKGVLVAFYDKQKDFVLQTENTINETILSDDSEPYEKNPEHKDDVTKQKFMADTVAELSAALMYYKYYNTINNGKEGENVYDELLNHLKKFGLEQYIDACRDKMPKMMMFIKQYLGTSLEVFLRKLNTNFTTKNSLSDNVMLYAQYVMNHYKVNSVHGLAKYINDHPWKKKFQESPTQDMVECVVIDGKQIYRADNTSFWERWFDKDYFYQEMVRKLDEDDWNEANGYEDDRQIFHNSKNSESFKKYLQHLTRNDNLSLYNGVVILNKIFHNDQGAIATMFGFTIEPIELNKESFIEKENKISWGDSESLMNSLFGDEDGYYEYRWSKTNIN